MNNKKRAIADREGLESDEEEVEDLGLWRRLRKSCVQHMKGRQEVQGKEQKANSYPCQCQCGTHNPMCD
jgi:hypothetical protein